MDVARITYREGKTKRLTLEDYEALRFEEYAWVLDGFAAPPLCHRKGSSVKLKPAEFAALAKLVRSPGVALPPCGGLFEGRSTSKESAIRRFEAARSKVEPQRPRGGGSFPTIGDEQNRRYSFQPDPELKYGIVERLEPAVPVDSQRGVAWTSPVPWPLPDLSSLLGPYLPAQSGLKPSEPVHKLILKPAPPVEGITVLVHRLSLTRRHVRAHVTVSNKAHEPKFVGYFTLHLGESMSRAVRHLPGKHRRRARSSRATKHLEPEMLVVRARRAVVGFLFFTRPHLTGSVEAAVRPHVLRTQTVD